MTLVYLVQTHSRYDVTFQPTLVYSWIKLSPGKFTKKVLINKH